MTDECNLPALDQISISLSQDQSSYLEINYYFDFMSFLFTNKSGKVIKEKRYENPEH